MKYRRDNAFNSRYNSLRKPSMRVNNVKKHSEYKLNKRWAFVRNAIRPSHRMTIRKCQIIGVGQYSFTSLSFMTSARNKGKQHQIRINRKCLKWDFRKLWFKRYIPMKKRFGSRIYSGYIRVA